MSIYNLFSVDKDADGYTTFNLIASCETEEIAISLVKCRLARSSKPLPNDLMNAGNNHTHHGLRSDVDKLSCDYVQGYVCERMSILTSEKYEKFTDFLETEDEYKHLML
jgi:hypothetical protein